MTIYTFDFDEIAEQQDFYREFSRAFALPDKQVDNLDALWSAVTEGAYRSRWRLNLSIWMKNSVVALAR